MNQFTRRMIICCAAIGQLLVGSVWCGTAWCDEHALEDNDLSEHSLEQLMQMTAEKVVTASRFSQRVTEAPASMTVITSDDIRKYGYRTLADALRSVAGLYVSYDRNYSYLGVRGFSRPGDYNSRVLMMIDGHRTSDNIYDTAAIGSELVLDIDLIDHIEFMRGPGSSLYGSNAFFGVINIITRTAADVKRELSTSAANYETWTGRASYGATFDSGLEMLLSGTIYDSAGQRSLFFPEFTSSPSGGYTYHSDYDSNKSVYARFTLSDFTLSGLFGSRKKGIPTGAYGTLFNDPNTRSIDERGYVDLAYHKSYSNLLDVSARLFYDHYGYEGTYVTDNGAPPSTTNVDTALGNWWGAETIVTLPPMANNTLSLGGEFRHNPAQNQKNVDLDPAATYLDDKRSSVNWGLFVQDEYHVLKSLRINLGVRYDNYAAFDAINPRAALIYTPVEATALKLLYSEAFRAPNAFERFYQDGTTSVANPGLQPEKIRTFDAIWEQYFLDHYRSSMGAFYYWVNDLISQTTNADNNLVFHNIGNAQAIGVALSLEGSWQNGAKGRLSYDWQQATDVTSGALLSNSPRHLVKANMSIPLFRQQLFISPELQYTSPRLTLSGTHTNDPLTVNLTLFCRDLGLSGLEASVSIYNLFNVQAQDVAGPEHGQQPNLPPLQVIRQDGTNFRFKLTYRF